MAIATPRWSDRTFEQSKEGGLTRYVATLAYDVIQANNEAEAIAAVPFRDGSAHDVFPGLLVCSGFSPQKMGFDYWRVRVNFRSDATGGDIEGRFATVEWEPVVTTDEVDRDANDQAILNSAGFPPQNTQTNESYDLQLMYTYFAKTYDPRLALSVLNRMNSDAFTVVAPWTTTFTVNPGECMCVGYQPTGAFLENAAIIQIRQQFLFRERTTDQISGFDFRFMDTGNVGWFGNTAVDQASDQYYYSGSREPVSEPVRLNGSGVPISSTVKVGRNLRPARPTPNPVTWAKLDKRFSQDAVFMAFQKKKKRAFKGLNRLFT